MRALLFFVMVAIAGCTGLSGMVSSYDGSGYVSKQNFMSALVSMSESTAFEVSGFDRGTFYPDCGSYLDDYGGNYSYGRACKVYGQADMRRYIYIFEFASGTSLEEFRGFLSSIKKFSPELSASSINNHSIIVFDNGLRRSYSFTCGSNMILMLSQDLSNPNQDESELRSLAYAMLAYCDRYRIV